jgi:hypothetical protein
MKKLIVITLLAVMALTLGASAPIQSIRLTIGGDVAPARYILDRKIPLSVPLRIDWDKPLGGCGGTARQSAELRLSATLSLYYNSDTGESHARLDGATYNIVLSASGEPTATPAQ